MVKVRLSMAKRSKRKGSDNKKKTDKIPSGSVKSATFFQEPVVHILIIVVLGILIYSNTFNVPFAYDDIINISNNPIIKDVRHLIDPQNIYDNRLIGNLTFALNYATARTQCDRLPYLQPFDSPAECPARLLVDYPYLQDPLCVCLSSEGCFKDFRSLPLDPLIYSPSLCKPSGSDPGRDIYCPKICISIDAVLSGFSGHVYQGKGFRLIKEGKICLLCGVDHFRRPGHEDKGDCLYLAGYGLSL